MILILSILSLALVFFYKIFPFLFGLVNLDLSDLESVFSDGGYRISVIVSFVWALVNSLVLTFVSTLLAWTSRRKKFLGILLFLPWAVPMYLSTMAWRYAIYGVGGRSLISFLGIPNDILTNPIVAFLWATFVNVWINLPVVTFSILASLRRIPEEIYESARLDGASEGEVFSQITLPLLRSTVIGWFLINFVRFFHSFTVPYLLVSGGPLMSWGYTRWGIVGVTTTLGVYNFSVFSKSMNPDTIIPYSLVTFFFMLFLVSLWMRWNRRDALLILALGELIWFALGKNPLSLIASSALVLSYFEKRSNVVRKIILIASPVVTILSGFDVVLMTFVVRELSIRRSFRMRISSRFVNFLGKSAVFVLLVSVVILILALLSTLGGGDPVPGLFRGIDIGIFRELFDEGYSSYLMNSLEISLPVSILAPLLSFPLAYKISRKGWDWLITLFAVLQSLGGVHLLMVIYSIYVKLGVIDSKMSVIPLILSNVIPQVLIMTRGMIDTIGKEYEDYAMLEGGRIAAVRVVFRMALPVVFVGSLVGFMGGWNAFLAPLMLIISEWKYPVSVKLYDFIGDPMNGYPRWDLFGAGTVINLFVIGIFFYTTRRFLKGWES